MASSAARTTVYTDGACSGNPGPGGWAWIVPDGPFAAGAEAHTTNQRMELTAVLDAVGALEGPLEVVSDSTYVVNCFRDRWWEGWLARGWLTSAKKPVANRDLWEPLVAAVRAGDVVFTWVKGHGGNRWNDLADRLAVEAAARQAPRSGATTPTEVGAPDRPQKGRGPGAVAVAGANHPGAHGASPTAAGADAARPDPTGRNAPAGHRLVVLGHRPRALGGDGALDAAGRLRNRLIDIVAAKAQVDQDLVVLSGLRQGAEMLGAEAAVAAGVPMVAVLPYPSPEAPWDGEAQRRFRSLCEQAAEVITLQAKEPTSTQAARGALARRDAWFVRNAHEAVVVWDGDDDAIGKTVRSLRERVGEEDVWVVDPREFA